MKKTKTKKIIIGLIIIAIIIVILCAFFCVKKDETELKSVKSKAELLKIYEGDDNELGERLLGALVMPYNLIYGINTRSYSKADLSYSIEEGVTADAVTNTTGSSTSKEHSTTNIQVENVDEADITKTDGDYIYSISESKVVITNVIDPNNIKIETTITPTEDYIPEDLILYGNRLVVISTQYINYSKSNTSVGIYDITTKSKPRLLETFSLHEKYYTSRSIDGKLIIIASGGLRKENNEIDTYYEEDNVLKEIKLEDIKYLKGLESDDQTIIASYDLNKSEDVKVKSYLFNVKNAYISKENMYLLQEEYIENEMPLIRKLFGFGGVIGFFKYSYDYDYNYNKETYIYKFNIKDDGNVKYDCKAKTEGTTINQFSLDEYQGNLRIGLYTDEGSRIAVFDKNLKLLGETQKLAEGEKMYSTRFVGNKAYMVTYKTIDPLFVIDLSDATNPTVLGKLKIPGYSTYLQPYDDTHIIGIGMQTEEKINRNSSGKIISTSAVITGMKMALFDITDVNNPIQISDTIIGDSRATSAVLTNHKALLFDKEKGIIAIPVNNYDEDFKVSTSDAESISGTIASYENYYKNYVSEGYFVYNINVEEGFKLKGTITHENASTKGKFYNNKSKLLKGLWIEDNLYTISEKMIKVNRLEDLSEVSSLVIK